MMDAVHEERFLVFLRPEKSPSQAEAESAEQPLASCASYADARRIRQSLTHFGLGECVIRYVGPAGGGD
jgi:hypothetical protein